MVRKSEAMARESLGWRERGQANRTRNIELFFVREEEKRADWSAVRRRDGAGSKRRGDSEGPLGQQVNECYIPARRVQACPKLTVKANPARHRERERERRIHRQRQSEGYSIGHS